MSSVLFRLATLSPTVAAVGLCTLLGGAGCKGSSTDPQVSTETHFLKYCASECAPGLSCLCGVCTRACTGANECSELAADARCVSISESLDAGVASSCRQGATCDVACIANVECEALGNGYRCEGGYCRKGSRVCPAQPLAPGDETRDIVVGGTVRSYTTHVPATYPGSSPVPLVLDFHPTTLGASWEQSNSGFKELSDQEGFIVVWPHGLEDSWNLGPCCTASKVIDDFAFVRAIVRQLSNEGCIDPQRVYATGFSMGAGMAYYLACQQAEVFAAVATSGMDLLVDSQLTCQPSRPIAAISFRGADDTVVPYAGGSTSPPGHPEMSMEVLGAVETLEKWASLDHCTGAPSVAGANGCSTYSNCQGGVEVTLCTIQGAGQVVGNADMAWSFLKKHPMP